MSVVESQNREPTRPVPQAVAAAEGSFEPDGVEIDGLAEALAVENEQLRDALQTRELIGRATGVLMGQRRCDADEALALLIRLSQDTNTKLRDVADAFLDEFRADLPTQRQPTTTETAGGTHHPPGALEPGS
ncbi:ANTAR domain-containing protein [Amycolatopsis sp. NPDC051903]|uniref:ANTAR domain-containing protein n=1 Tax=Amycolatopsis sp. NPDC051903 TaxID=3363936 RepID=UPI0037AC5FC1